MKKILFITLTAFILISCASKPDPKILIYTKNGEGFVHDNIEASVEAISELADEYAIDYDISEDPSVFTDENLAQYDAIVFSNTNNDAFDTNVQRLAFVRYTQAGGGFVGIHSACGSERNWPWFWKMIGGTFVRHCPYQPFNVKIIDPDHTSTSFFNGEWEWEDEGYYLHHLNPDIHVLLAHDMTTIEDKGKDQFPGKVFGELFPGAWCHEFDGGRQWYTSYGHSIEHYDDYNFRKHIIGGILWAIENGKPDYSKARTTSVESIQLTD